MISTWKDWLFLGVGILLMVLAFPCVIYCTLQLKQHWHEVYFIKRRRRLIFASVTLCIIMLLVELPYYVIDGIFGNGYFTTRWLIMQYCNWFIILWFINIYTIRLYAVYFDHRYNEAIINADWILEIGRESVINQNWFINHKNTVGNSRKLLLFGTIVAVLIEVVYLAIKITVDAAYPDENIFVESIFAIYLFVDIIILWQIYKRVSTYKDVLHLKNEFRMFHKCCLFVFIAIFLVEIVEGTANVDNSWLVIHIVQCIIWSMFIYIQTGYVVRLNKCSKNNKNSDNSNENIRESKVNLYADWRKIIAIKDGYNEFMSFLKFEFAIENLLFISEVKYNL